MKAAISMFCMLAAISVYDVTYVKIYKFVENGQKHIKTL